MVGRDRDEPHRASTPLELLFDLCFVVAVAQAAAAAAPRARRGPRRHGARRLPARVLRDLVGVDELHLVRLGLRHRRRAVPAADVRADRRRAGPRRRGARGRSTRATSPWSIVGYVDHAAGAGRPVAARGRASDPARRAAGAALRRRHRASCRSAGSLRLVAARPVGLVGVPRARRSPSCAVPVWAERAGRRRRWHPDHIAERYGLFTIIVLGESILAATDRGPGRARRRRALGRAARGRRRRAADRVRAVVAVLQADRRTRRSARCGRSAFVGATATTSCSPRSPRSAPASRSRPIRLPPARAGRWARPSPSPSRWSSTWWRSGCSTAGR